MKVLPCPSCGARYNVERLPDGSRFECRRCGQTVHVAETSLPPTRFSLGLLLSGVLTLVGLLLYANPEFGWKEARWPWELVGGAVGWSTQVTVILWAVAGVWALVTSLGIAAPLRSVVTVALAGTLVLMCTKGVVSELSTAWPLEILAALIALGAGLLLAGRPDTHSVARAMAFTGGLMLVWPYALPFLGTPDVALMIEDVKRLFNGQLAAEDALRGVIPLWTLLLTGVVGVIAGFGARGAFLVWTGLALACATLVLPTAAAVADSWNSPGHWDDVGRRIAQYGTSALVTSGLVLWLLSANALADLIRNRKKTS